MDDHLEQPSADLSVIDRQQNENNESSDDEDEGPDWANLPPASFSLARPVLPKRGDKEHEPARGGETRLQHHVLDRSRNAMYDALRAERGSSSKSLSHAIWDHTVSRAIVVAARGIHFASIGHSVLQPSHNHESEAPPSKSSQHKQLHLLPEEALYLIERGTLACYWADDSVNEYTEHTRPVISVQQAYTAMLGTVELSMEKYQVYSYLKRLGYVVTRANPPTSDYPVPQQQACDQPASSSGRWLSLAGMLLGSPFRSLTNLLSHKAVDWWRPLLLSSLTSFTSGGLYQGIRQILPRSHSLQRSVPSPEAPYKVFFNVYKPITPFRKTTPTQPDYQIVIVDAQTTPMPTLAQFDALFSELERLPTPLPRKRTQTLPPKYEALAHSTTSENSLLSRARRYLLSMFSTTPTAVPNLTPPRPNPFTALKQGNKIIIIAVVDGGSISFFRFGEGCFEDWPMA